MTCFEELAGPMVRCLKPIRLLPSMGPRLFSVDDTPTAKLRPHCEQNSGQSRASMGPRFISVDDATWLCRRFRASGLGEPCWASMGPRVFSVDDMFSNAESLLGRCNGFAFNGATRFSAWDDWQLLSPSLKVYTKTRVQWGHAFSAVDDRAEGGAHQLDERRRCFNGATRFQRG